MYNYNIKKINTLIICPGHGRDDPGAVYNDYTELNQVIYISKKLVEKLRKKGINAVYATENFGLQKRINYLNQNYNNLEKHWALEIHRDSFTPAVKDSSTRCGLYYFEADANSFQIANQIKNSFIENTKNKNCWARPHGKTSYRPFSLGFIEKTSCFAHLLELGFMQGKNSKNHLEWLTNIAYKAIIKVIKENDLKDLYIKKESESQKIHEKITDVDFKEKINEIKTEKNSSEKKFYESKKFIAFGLALIFNLINIFFKDNVELNELEIEKIVNVLTILYISSQSLIDYKNIKN